MKVLNIGAGIAPNPVEAWPGKTVEFTRMDADPAVNPDVVHDITKPLPEHLCGQFDAVYASHVLEHIGWRWIIFVMNNISKAVRDDGSMVLIVPDFEWACRQILRHRYSYGVLGVFYGGQYTDWDYHRMGFTRATMLESLRKIGWKPVKQLSEPFLAIIEGEEERCYQLTTVAVRDDR